MSDVTSITEVHNDNEKNPFNTDGTDALDMSCLG